MASSKFYPEFSLDIPRTHQQSFIFMKEHVLSELAMEILLEASSTGSLLNFFGATGHRRLSINNRYFGDGTTIENIANELALRELIAKGFIVRAPYLEQTYKIATEGYILADRLAESAVN